MLAAIILTAGSVYAPVYAAAGDGIVPDTNMTHVSEGNVIPDGDAQEGSTENDEPTETGNDEELSSEEESSVTETASEIDSEGTEGEDMEEASDEGSSEAVSEDEGLTEDNGEDPDGSVTEEEESETADATVSGDAIKEIKDIKEIQEEDTELLEAELNPDGYFVLEGNIIKGVTDKGKAATEMVIPEGIRGIGASAVQNCTSLEKVTIPSTLTNLGGSAFSGCSSLSTLVINSSSFKVGGADAFAGCRLSSVTLPENMTVIPKLLFHGAKFDNYNLIIGKNITGIESEAFKKATGISTLSFEAGSKLSTVGEEAFWEAGTISQVVLPDSVTKIESNAFRSLNLTEITVPKNVKFLGGNAFSENPLEKIIIESAQISTTAYSDGVFVNKDHGDGIEILTFPEGIKTIPQKIFRDSKFKDTEIVIPKSVTSIGAYAFGNLRGSVKSVTFEPGSKLKAIGENGFMFNGIKNENVATKFRVESGSYAEKWLRQAGFTNIIAPFDLGKTTVTLKFGGAAGTGTDYTGSAIEPEVVVKKDGSAVDPSLYNVAYKNNKDAGTAWVIITAQDEEKCFGIKEVSFTIKGLMLSDKKTFTVDCPASIEWAGEGKKSEAAIKVVNKKTNEELSPGTDYSLFYSDTSKPGKVTVNVVGIGGYDGSRTVTYTVAKPNFKDADDSEDAEFKVWSPRTQDIAIHYNTQPQKPDIKVDYKGKTLTPGVNYTVKYKNNVNAYTIAQGEPGFNKNKAPAIIITGKGNFTGTWTGYFVIRPCGVWTGEHGSATVEIPTQKATGRPVTPVPKITVDFGNGITRVLKAGTDYAKPAKDDYGNNTEPSVSKTGDDRPYVIIKTKEGSNYSTGDMKVYFEIASKDNNLGDKKLFAVSSLSNREFTGTEIELTPEEISKLVGVRAAKNSSEISRYLEKDKDYVLTYKNNKNAGKVTVTISGIGNYYGSRTATFKITRKAVKNESDLGKFVILLDGEAGIPEYLYTGYAIKPVVKVSDSDTGYELIEGRDYSVKYANNTAVTSEDKDHKLKYATATVTFKGNYAGNKRAKTTSVTAKYKINGWKMAEEMILFDSPDCDYNNGKEVKLLAGIGIKYNGSDVVKVNPKAYKIVYSDNKYPGTATLTASPTKNSGITEGVTFTMIVSEGRMYNTKVTAVKPQTYRGKPVTPKVTVKYRGKKLKENTDYTVSYTNNDRKGMATVTVTAVEGSHFWGYTEKEFLIK